MAPLHSIVHLDAPLTLPIAGTCRNRVPSPRAGGAIWLAKRWAVVEVVFSVRAERQAEILEPEVLGVLATLGLALFKLQNFEVPRSLLLRRFTSSTAPREDCLEFCQHIKTAILFSRHASAQ